MCDQCVPQCSASTRELSFPVNLPVMRRCHVASRSLLETLRVIQHRVGVGGAASGERGRGEKFQLLYLLFLIHSVLERNLGDIFVMSQRAANVFSDVYSFRGHLTAASFLSPFQTCGRCNKASVLTGSYESSHAGCKQRAK